METYSFESVGIAARTGIEDNLYREGDAYFIRLKTDDSHMNSHGSIHGGMLYTLCLESIARIMKMRGLEGIGMEGSIHYYRPAFSGDTLKAVVHERRIGRRTGTYQVELFNEVTEKLLADATYTIFFQQSYRD